MLDLGPHANFILAAYGLSLITLITLTIWVHMSEHHHKQKLSFFSKDKE